MQSRTNRNVARVVALLGVLLAVYISWKIYAGHKYGRDFSGIGHKIKSYIELGRKGIWGLGGRIFLACTNANRTVVIVKANMPHESIMRDHESDRAVIFIKGNDKITKYQIDIFLMNYTKTHYFSSLKSSRLSGKTLIKLVAALADDEMRRLWLYTMERGLFLSLVDSARDAKAFAEDCSSPGMSR